MNRLIMISLTAIRIVFALVAIWQLFTIFPAVIWFQNISSVSANMWAILILKFTVFVVFVFAYFILTKWQKKTKNDASPIVDDAANDTIVHHQSTVSVTRQRAFDRATVRNIRNEIAMQKNIRIEKIDPDMLVCCGLCKVSFDKSKQNKYMAITVCPSCYKFKNGN